MNNSPNIRCDILVVNCRALDFDPIEELLRWLPVRDQSSGQCCPTPSSVRRTVGVCESLPEHCAILLCIEVHFVWVVLLWYGWCPPKLFAIHAKLKSLALCSHSAADKHGLCKGGVSLSYFAEAKHTCKHAVSVDEVFLSVWWQGEFGAAEKLWFSRSNDHTRSGVVIVEFWGLVWIAVVFRPYLGHHHWLFALRSPSDKALSFRSCHCRPSGPR